MKYNRGLLIAIFVCAIAYSFFRPEPKKTRRQQEPVKPEQVATEIESKARNVSSVSEESDEFKTKAANFTDVKFQNWFVGESGKLAKGSFTLSQEKQLRDKVRSMSSQTAIELKNHALSSQASGNDKVLAIYLLSLAGSAALDTIGDFIAAPLKFNEAAPAHSVNESRRMQERSLRIMAIDSLADRGKTDPNALQKLKDLMQSINDSYIAQYISKKINEITN